MFKLDNKCEEEEKASSIDTDDELALFTRNLNRYFRSPRNE